MHTKTELEALPIEELTTMAKALDIPTKKDTEKLELIYSIIEAELSQAPAPAESKQPKKRGRKSNAEKAALASVEALESLQQEAEAATTGKKKAKSKTAAAKVKEEKTEEKVANEEPVAAPIEEATPAPEAPAPKKRGRKSKAEKAAEEAAARAAELQPRNPWPPQRHLRATTFNPLSLASLVMTLLLRR